MDRAVSTRLFRHALRFPDFSTLNIPFISVKRKPELPFLSAKTQPFVEPTFTGLKYFAKRFVKDRPVAASPTTLTPAATKCIPASTSFPFLLALMAPAILFAVEKTGRYW